jgi:hypothetical protein
MTWAFTAGNNGAALVVRRVSPPSGLIYWLRLPLWAERSRVCSCDVARSGVCWSVSQGLRPEESCCSSSFPSSASTSCFPAASRCPARARARPCLKRPSPAAARARTSATVASGNCAILPGALDAVGALLLLLLQLLLTPIGSLHTPGSPRTSPLATLWRSQSSFLERCRGPILSGCLQGAATCGVLVACRSPARRHGNAEAPGFHANNQYQFYLSAWEGEGPLTDSATTGRKKFLKPG